MNETHNLNHLCPICQGIFKQLFITKVLGKYSVSYYLCSQCGLMQTEKPYWLDEAYSSAIADLDVGLVQRNIKLSVLTVGILENFFSPCARYLDFAGGYGLFVRLMRDTGFDFYRYDKYCENIFAQYFDITSLQKESLKFELVTAFEVLEHVVDPLEELRELFKMTDSVLLTTELIPSGISTVNDWWYFVPETGQHITFYSEKSFRVIADALGVNYYGDGHAHHLLSKKKIKKFSFSGQDGKKYISKLTCKIIDKLSQNKKNKSVEKHVSTAIDFAYVKHQTQKKQTNRRV